MTRVLLLVLAMSSPAWAQAPYDELVRPVPPPGPEYPPGMGPLVPAVITGGVIFLGGYVPSAIVAASSGHRSDRWLWMPVFGPWFDLEDRRYQSSTLEDVALIVNGSVQAIGAITLVAGFLMPTPRKRTIRVVPAAGGASIVGTF